MNDAITDDLRLAHMLADAADAASMDRFRTSDLHCELKADQTLVTDADLAVEAAVRSMLGRVRQRDAILGEEQGESGYGPRRWVIDPIDGTANYARGVSVWATLIALEIDEQPVLGVVSAPALGRRWWASQEGGAWTGRTLMHGSPLQVSDVATIEHAFLTYSDIDAWVASGHGQEFVDLLRMVERSRGFGDFWNYMLVAEGGVDIAAEPKLARHDMSACAIIVTEAGGQFTNLDGDEGPVGPGALASNGLLHEALQRQLSGIDDPGPAAPL